MTRVLFICHGNICRSPMAQSIFMHLVKKQNLANKFSCNSAATSTEELGNFVHHGTVSELEKHDIAVIPHKAVQLKKADYADYDYLIAMDSMNVKNIFRIIGEDKNHKVYKLLSFTNSDKDVADPWYTGDFSATFSDIMRGCTALLEFLQNQKSL